MTKPPVMSFKIERLRSPGAVASGRRSSGRLPSGSALYLPFDPGKAQALNLSITSVIAILAI